MKKLFVVFLVLAVLIGGYAFWWQKGANQLKEHVEAQLAHASIDGSAPTYEKLDITGFPFAYEVQLTNPKLSWVESLGPFSWKVDGTFIVGASLLSDWGWLSTSGKSEFSMPSTKNFGETTHWIATGDSKLSGHTPDFIDPQVGIRATYLMQWVGHLFRGFTWEAKDLVVMDGAAPDKTMASIKDGLIVWSKKKDGTFTTSMKMKDSQWNNHFSNVGNSLTDYTFSAHGVLPTDIVANVGSLTWETFPSFSFVIDESSATSPLSTGTGTMNLSFDNQPTFVALDYVLKSTGTTTKLYRQVVVEQLQQMAQVDPEQLSPDERPFYVYLKEHLKELQDMVPDLSNFGKTAMDVSFYGKAMKEAQPSQYPKQLYLDLKELSWLAEPYGFIVKQEMAIKDPASVTGRGTVQLIRYVPLIEDLSGFVVKGYRLFSGSTNAPEPGVVASKVRAFLEQLSDPSVAKDSLLIRINAEDPENMMIGPLKASEAAARLHMLVEELMPQAPQVPQKK